MSETAPTTKIVIVAGQQFSVPGDTDNETVRQQLLGMGFADVANAEIKKSKTAEGVETVEFVKKAGTKGLTGADLAARLRHIAPAPLPPEHSAAKLRFQLFGERLTFEEAVAEDAALNALRATATVTAVQTIRGGQLCQQLDALPAVASRDALTW